MKLGVWTFIPLMITVFFLIRAEFARNKARIHLLKPISSGLLIVTALLALTVPNHSMTYLTGILIGLGLSFAGDMLLMFHENHKMFLSGLVAFLLGHIAYTITLTIIGDFHPIDAVSMAVLAVWGTILVIILYPNLGKMKIPVILYIIIISLMVNRALSTLVGAAFTVSQSWMIAIGALLFYISDLILALGRFGKPFHYHRINLAFYYAGQFLLALSISYPKVALIWP